MTDRIVVATAAIEVVIITPDDGYPYLEQVTPVDNRPDKAADRFCPIRESYPPLVEVRLDGEGNSGSKTGKSLIGAALSQRLRYQSHTCTEQEHFSRVAVVMVDSKTSTTVTAHLELSKSVPLIRSRASVVNGHATLSKVVHQVSSLVIGGLADNDTWWKTHTLLTANNSWFREAQWVEQRLPDLGLDNFGFDPVKRPDRQSMAYHSLSNRSTFTTQGHLPMGVLKGSEGGDLWIWQVENNGAWRTDIGDCGNSLYLATTGPEASNHDWRIELKPGESYTTCWTALSHLPPGSSVDQAFQAMTRYRRLIVRPHPDHSSLPIIFNDYMNCLDGDPTEEKILSLLGPVSKTGAEYFVVDAGWYADDTGWWEEVGAWEPSSRRFPSGFGKLMSTIAQNGLRPGLWIEPEVIGVRSPLADLLPHSGFLQRDGKRIIEQGRYHLDFRHPAVRHRMDGVIDRLVVDYGIGYFKFDYNIEHVLGTDIHCFSAGKGQQGHSTAYLSWVEGLLDRYPTLVIENCSSGGMRMDYGMLSVHTVQSTSDQEDPILYAAISASIPTAVIPEQSASWAYPTSSWSDETNALTIANSLLGRVHLSGRLDQLSASQLQLVNEGMQVYKELRLDLRSAVPFWPLGLRSWSSDSLALGMRSDFSTYLMVWRRGGERSMDVPIEMSAEKADVEVELLFPKSFQSRAVWDSDRSTLIVSLPEPACARLYRLRAR